MIVGGGIAGLAAAASLIRQGWSVTVLEQAAQFTEIGAGLAITANGMSALAALGLDSSARQAGQRLHMAGTMDHRGNWLMRIPRSAASGSLQEATGIHRQELHRLLLQAAHEAQLVTGVRVSAVDPGSADGPLATVRCSTDEGNQSYEAELVVAADGLRSTVRSQLVPATGPKYSGKSSWRGIIDDTSLVSDKFAIMWGPGAEFGALRISAEQVYWYGYVHSAEHQKWHDEKSAALEHFGEWADPVPSLITATPVDRLMRHNVYSLSPQLPTYVHGRTNSAHRRRRPRHGANHGAGREHLPGRRSMHRAIDRPSGGNGNSTGGSAEALRLPAKAAYATHCPPIGVHGLDGSQPPGKTRDNAP